MNLEPSDYGLWSLAIINSLVFIIFAFSFTKPKTPRDWRSFSAFSAFVAALFAEMYGFPLTIFLLSGWLQTNYPGVDFLSHDAGHLWHTLLGWKGDPHTDRCTCSVLCSSVVDLFCCLLRGKCSIRRSAVISWRLPGLTQKSAIPSTTLSC